MREYRAYAHTRVGIRTYVQAERKPTKKDAASLQVLNGNWLKPFSFHPLIHHRLPLIHVLNLEHHH